MVKQAYEDKIYPKRARSARICNFFGLNEESAQIQFINL